MFCVTRKTGLRRRKNFMFRRTSAPVAAAPEPTPPAPLTVAEQFELAKSALKNASDHCQKLDAEFRAFATRRECAHKIFQSALKRHLALESEMQEINGNGAADAVIMPTGAVLQRGEKNGKVLVLSRDFRKRSGRDCTRDSCTASSRDSRYRYAARVTKTLGWFGPFDVS